MLVVFRSRFRRPSQRWFWKYIHANGRELCRSSEGYYSKDEALRQARKVLGGAYKDFKYNPD